MSWPRFTTPAGAEVAINPALVAEVRAPQPFEMDHRARTVIMFSQGYQAVREDQATVERMLGI